MRHQVEVHAQHMQRRGHGVHTPGTGNTRRYGASSAAHTVKKAVATIKANLPDDVLSKLGANTWASSSFNVHFVQRISVALQRDNAKTIIERAQLDFRMALRPEATTSPPRAAT